MYLNYETIGKRIRLLRKQQHLTQMTLAEMVDKSPTYISLVENGQKGPSLETLIDVANALKVTMDVLLAEYIEQNTAAAGAELSAIIEDCSEYEKRVIIDGARSLKQVFREAGHLVRRRYRYWIYRHGSTPYEQKQCYSDESLYEETCARIGILREVISLADGDALLGFAEIIEDTASNTTLTSTPTSARSINISTGKPPPERAIANTSATAKPAKPVHAGQSALEQV